LSMGRGDKLSANSNSQYEAYSKSWFFYFPVILRITTKMTLQFIIYKQFSIYKKVN